MQCRADAGNQDMINNAPQVLRPEANGIVLRSKAIILNKQASNSERVDGVASSGA
jgi:hypothetical protein